MMAHKVEKFEIHPATTNTVLSENIAGSVNEDYVEDSELMNELLEMDGTHV